MLQLQPVFAICICRLGVERAWLSPTAWNCKLLTDTTPLLHLLIAPTLSQQLVALGNVERHRLCLSFTASLHQVLHLLPTP